MHRLPSPQSARLTGRESSAATVPAIERHRSATHPQLEMRDGLTCLPPAVMASPHLACAVGVPSLNRRAATRSLGSSASRADGSPAVSRNASRTRAFASHNQSSRSIISSHPVNWLEQQLQGDNQSMGMRRRRPHSARRFLLATLLLPLPLAALARPAVSEAAEASESADLTPLLAYWGKLMSVAKGKLGDGFSGGLVFYGSGTALPSGSPGDPAMDYQSSSANGGSGACGDFQAGDSRPYSMCLAPGSEPTGSPMGTCCRHFAYCVPYSRFAFAEIDKQSNVVASQRMALLPEQTWQGILTHEAGHCIDFYVFGGRYGLYDHGRSLDPEVFKRLKPLGDEADAEIRADDMANTVFGDSLGRKICYSPTTTLQALVGPDETCQGSEPLGAASSTLLEHFPHPAPQGTMK